MRQNGFKQRLKGDVVEMDIYGVIGLTNFEEDDFVSTAEVMRGLKEMGSIKTLRLFFNSPGGNVYDGFQLANRLDQLREDGKIQEIESYGEGLVASAATLPYLKADRRVMRNGARFMIHKPWAFGGGTADQMRAEAVRLDQTEQEALDLYESVSALTRAEIASAMESETFYTPKESEAVGWATEVAEPFAVAACMSGSLRAQFKHLPQDLKIQDPRDRDLKTLERAHKARQLLKKMRDKSKQRET